MHQLQEPRAVQGVEEAQAVLQVPRLLVRQVHEDGGHAQELRGTDGQAARAPGGRAARTGAPAEPGQLPGRAHRAVHRAGRRRRGQRRRGGAGVRAVHARPQPQRVLVGGRPVQHHHRQVVRRL